MCFAILKVAYRNSASPVWVEVEKEQDLEEKIKEVQQRAEVISIRRYHLYTSYNLVPVWQESQNEESNQGTIPSMSEGPAPATAPTGPSKGEAAPV